MKYYADDQATLYLGDALEVLRTLPDGSINCCVTSPPYFGLRDYGVAGQIGAEASPAEFVAALVAVFAEVRRVLADDGTLWLNLGDSYYSGRGNPGPNSDDEKNFSRRGWTRALDKPGADWARPKSMIGIPWRVALALIDAGWILRNDVIWNKANGMPGTAKDRLTSKHEFVFMLSKSRFYWFGGDYTDGDVWTIPTQPFPDAHFAVMPTLLAEECITDGCKPGGTVLDPFSGSGTTGLAAARLGRRYVGIDLNREYLDLSLRTRLAQPSLTAEAGGAA